MRADGGMDRLVAIQSHDGHGLAAPGVAASLALHMALAAAAVVIRFAAFPPAPRELPVSVSIVTLAMLEKAQPRPAVLAAAPVSGDPARHDPDEAEGMVHATTMLSAKTLADPRSRQAVADLATFSDSERVVQLCNLEAMDQVEHWRDDFHPERVVAFARAGEKMVGNTIIANGAAFRSRDRWFDLKFRCEVAPDHASVVAFAFHVGDPVPRAEWEGLGLPAVH